MASKDLVQRTYKHHILTMKIFGLYPFDSYPGIFRIYSLTFWILLTFLTPMLSLISLIAGGIPDIETFSQGGFITVQLTNLATKMIPCISNPTGIKRTIFALNQKIFNSQLPDQEFLITDAVKNCRYIYQLYLYSCLIAIINWGGAPLMFEERTFPIKIWLPFNAFQNTKIYVAIYVFQILCIINACGDNTAVVTMIASQIYHAACQIRVLKNTLMYLEKRTDAHIEENHKFLSPAEKQQLKSDLIYDRICHCIHHYDAIYKFVEDLEKTYHLVVFSQMFASSMVLCISCIHLSVATPFTLPFFNTVTFSTAVIVELFLYCYPGTLLFEESNSVVTAIFMSQWYNFDRRSKKALFILMERAKRPMKVTAGKLMDLTLETYGTIVRRSYSLLAIMKNY